MLRGRGQLAAGVHALPQAIDHAIATLKLQAMGMAIDTLTVEQVHYLASWEEGT
ncbi:MAG TPA: adenosylhomocysteinase [Roseiflexaceae bacterium]|nr:adenosylhomocysteinase [Roseiflexaceae bacterium]HMP39270.1 adenosylhomocysteinase [Roseiflexaceae bacterium]